MNVVLKMTRGPCEGTRRVLQEGQRVFIGRSRWTDFPAADATLADPQLVVKCTRTECWVQNLSLAATLMVNGVALQKKKLSHGDIVSVGHCDIMAKFRGQAGVVERILTPFVDMNSLAELFAGGVASLHLPPDHERDEEVVIPPTPSAEFYLSRDEGKGVPSIELLKKMAHNRHGCLILDAAAVPMLKKMPSILPVEWLHPVKMSFSAENHLFLICDRCVDDLHPILATLWPDHQVAFFLPRTETSPYLHRIGESAMWNGRTIAQVAGLLIDGPHTFRQSAFEYLDSLLLPKGFGWGVVSRATEKTVGKTQQDPVA
jgi:hypothetical protein